MKETMPFADVIGQKQVIRTLQNSLLQRRLPHALLFIGPEGVGKHLTAGILAQAINCEKEIADACGNCLSCLRIERNSYPDVSVLKPSGISRQIGIDSIRQLCHNISLKPMGRGKVYIISEADRMTVEASNALLKVLEEPPENSTLILIASSSERLFSTVISRCQMMRFFPLQEKEVRKNLIQKFSIPPEKGKFLSRLSEGSIGKAIYLDGKARREERAKVLSTLERISHSSVIGEAIPIAEDIMEIIDSFKREIKEKADKEINSNAFSQAEIKEIKRKLDADISGKVRAKLLEMLDIILSWYRDILLLKVNGKNLLINLEQVDRLQAAEKSFSIPSLMRIMEEIENTKEIISRNVSPRLAIEVVIIRIIEELSDGCGDKS